MSKVSFSLSVITLNGNKQKKFSNQNTEIGRKDLKQKNQLYTIYKIHFKSQNTNGSK